MRHNGLKDALEEMECEYGKSTPVYRQALNFMEDVFELAFGDDAINKGYTEDEVIARLRDFSDLALER